MIRGLRWRTGFWASVSLVLSIVAFVHNAPIPGCLFFSIAGVTFLLLFVLAKEKP